jgi:hypothetical protein
VRGSYRGLPPRADERAALVAAREARIARVGKLVSLGLAPGFFFATRAAERVMVAIEWDPTHAGTAGQGCYARVRMPMPPNSAPRSALGDGTPIHPSSTVVPVLREMAPRCFKVVGTACFITRYGLFVTARHVLQDLESPTKPGHLASALVLQFPTEDSYCPRRIMSGSYSNSADVAVAQASLSIEGGGRIANPRARLSFDTPHPDERLVTFAYPENETMDFTSGDVNPPGLFGDFVQGRFRSHVEAMSRPFLREAHYETSVVIRAGASGCPLFNTAGALVGIGSRGWDFRGGEQEGDELSSVIPLRHLLAINDICLDLPSDSWELQQVPVHRRNHHLSFGELVAYGHVDFSVGAPPHPPPSPNAAEA